jgi:hypothetical protein
VAGLLEELQVVLEAAQEEEASNSIVSVFLGKICNGIKHTAGGGACGAGGGAAGGA